MTKNLCVIPARSGSKRIPQKNIRNFCGKPMMAWSIEAAIESKLFNKIIVSTDSQQIAELAIHFGAEVPFIRPSELSDDFTGTTAVTRHALQYFSGRGMHFDKVCCLYATAPLIDISYLRQGCENLKLENCDTSFSATTFPFPVQRALKLSGSGVAPMFPTDIQKRSQDLEEAYHDAGQFYWWKSDKLKQGVAMFSEASHPILLPRYLVQDIDSEEDWLEAEHKFALFK